MPGTRQARLFGAARLISESRALLRCARKALEALAAEAGHEDDSGELLAASWVVRDAESRLRSVHELPGTRTEHNEIHPSG